MQDFRIAVGNSLKDKLGELGFFLQQIVDVTKVIECKHLSQDYPINTEIEKLNYFFSAYLNAIQSLKDGVQTTTNEKFSWKELSPTYGTFIRYCRNATTHDGYHLINSGKGTKNYISGPLRRIDNYSKVIEFDPPKQDIVSLCCNMTNEILDNLKEFLEKYGSNIPVVKEIDFERSIQKSFDSKFIPENVKSMIIRSNLVEIEDSIKDIKIDIVEDTMKAIMLLKTMVTNIQT